MIQINPQNIIIETYCRSYCWELTAEMLADEFEEGRRQVSQLQKEVESCGGDFLALLRKYSGSFFEPLLVLGAVVTSKGSYEDIIGCCSTKSGSLFAKLRMAAFELRHSDPKSCLAVLKDLPAALDSDSETLNLVWECRIGLVQSQLLTFSGDYKAAFASLARVLSVAKQFNLAEGVLIAKAYAQHCYRLGDYEMAYRLFTDSELLQSPQLARQGSRQKAKFLYDAVECALKLNDIPAARRNLEDAKKLALDTVVDRANCLFRQAQLAEATGEVDWEEDMRKARGLFEEIGQPVTLIDLDLAEAEMLLRRDTDEAREEFFRLTTRATKRAEELGCVPTKTRALAALSRCLLFYNDMSELEQRELFDKIVCDLDHDRSNPADLLKALGQLLQYARSHCPEQDAAKLFQQCLSLNKRIPSRTYSRHFNDYVEGRESQQFRGEPIYRSFERASLIEMYDDIIGKAMQVGIRLEQEGELNYNSLEARNLIDSLKALPDSSLRELKEDGLLEDE